MKVQVCTGKTCSERFCGYTKTRIENDKEKFGHSSLEIEESLCMGQCKYGPNIKIDGEINKSMNPAKASDLITKKIKK